MKPNSRTEMHWDPIDPIDPSANSLHQSMVGQKFQTDSEKLRHFLFLVAVSYYPHVD